MPSSHRRQRIDFRTQSVIVGIRVLQDARLPNCAGRPLISPNCHFHFSFSFNFLCRYALRPSFKFGDEFWGAQCQIKAPATIAPCDD